MTSPKSADSLGSHHQDTEHQKSVVLKKTSGDSPPSSSNDATSTLNVVLILDITGSMGDKMEAVKAMCHKFAEGIMASARGLQLHVITYTECPGCYTSHFTSSDPSTLVEYIDRLKLCQPPEFPSVDASGGDSPENILAGLATMAERIDTSIATIAFMITDAKPHFRNEHSQEAVAERAWLADRDYLPSAEEPDAYEVLHQVLDRFGGLLVLCPVLFATDLRQCHWYAHAARLTQGVMLMNHGRDASLLSASLLAIVEGLRSSRSEGRPVFQSSLQGFHVVDVSNVPDALSEEDAPGARAMEPLPNLADVTSAMYGLMESVLTIRGRKFTKRALTTAVSHVANCVRLMALLAQQLAHPAAEAPEVEELLKAVLDKLEPPDQAHLQKAVQRVRSAALPPTPSAPLECIISLDTAAEALLHLPTETERKPERWMEVVMRLLLVRLVDVQFPVKDGQPDLMDSWRANVKAVGPSVLTAFSAMQLRAEGVYRDPQSNATFTTALPFAHPTDPFASEVLALCSALPLLDQLTTYLASGKPLLFRNLWGGIAASSLLRQVRLLGSDPRPMTEGEWEQVRCWLHSLRLHARPLGSSVRSAMRQGYLNPADGVAMLWAALLWEQPRTPVPPTLLTMLAEEWVTDDVQWRAKQGFGAPPFAPSVLLAKDPETLIPLEELHPLEGGPGPVLHPEWRLRARTAVAGHPQRLPLQRQLEWALALLTVDPMGAEPPHPASALPFPFDDLFVESLLLERRTARYDLTHPPEGPPVHTRAAVDVEAVAKAWAKAQLGSVLQGWQLARATAMRARLLARAQAVRGTREECTAQLKGLSEELLGKEYRLMRMDAPAVLEGLAPDLLPSLGAAVVLDPWTPMPPSALRRHRHDILAAFQPAAQPELLAEIATSIAKTAVCCRATGTNRHGHHAGNPFPGHDGWTEAYAKALGRSRPDMEEYTAAAQRLRLQVASSPMARVVDHLFTVHQPRELKVLLSLVGALLQWHETHLAHAPSEAAATAISRLERNPNFRKLRLRVLPQIEKTLGHAPIGVNWAA